MAMVPKSLFQLCNDVHCTLFYPYIWPWFKFCLIFCSWPPFFLWMTPFPCLLATLIATIWVCLKLEMHIINVLCHDPTCHNARIIVAHLGPKFIPLHFCEQNDSFHKSSNSNMIVVVQRMMSMPLISFQRLFRFLWNNFVWLSMLLNLWLRRFGALVVLVKANFRHFLFHHVQLNLFCQ